MIKHRHDVRLLWESAALVALLASTWLIVGASLHDASTAMVSVGRTGFTVLGLLALTWWLTRRAAPASAGRRSTHLAAPRYGWWQVVLLALTGVTAYTMLSTIAINLAGPVLPTLVMMLTPAVVLVAEGVLARTRPPVPTVVGTFVAIVGAALFVIPRLAGTLGREVTLGALFAVAAMLSMAFYGIYFAQVNRNYRGAMAPRILPVFAVGTIPLAAWATADFAAGGTVSWSAIGMLALLGIVVYVPAYILQHRILLARGPSYSALLGLAVPPLVGVSAALLHLAGIPTPIQVIGMALTLLGMFLVIRRTLEPAKDTTMTASFPPIGVAIVGAGLRFTLIRAFLDTADSPFRLVGIADPNEATLNTLRDELPGVRLHREHRDLITAPEVEAVFVLTPDYLHARVGVDALNAGKATFIEKPLATSTTEADALIAAAERNNALLYVGHNMRQMPLVTKMREVVQSGLIGEPKAFWIRHFIGRGGDYFFKDWHAQRSLSGGLLVHKATHDLDAMAYILGSQYVSAQGSGVISVYKDAHKRAPNDPVPPATQSQVENWPPLAQRNLNPDLDVEDISHVNLVCANGVHGAYLQCHFTPDYWRNYCIIGTEGRAENFGDEGGDGVIKVWTRRRQGYDPEPDVEVALSECAESLNGHDGADLQILQNFADVIRGIEEAVTSVRDARNCVAAAELAGRSLTSDGRVLVIPPIATEE